MVRVLFIMTRPFHLDPPKLLCQLWREADRNLTIAEADNMVYLGATEAYAKKTVEMVNTNG